jgi:16S rRNA G966 N2-methylase RsmD
VLRKHIPDKCVNFVYLDPPFNSERDCNVIFKEATASLQSSSAEAYKCRE